jgi:hypothetical protein
LVLIYQAKIGKKCGRGVMGSTYVAESSMAMQGDREWV